MRGNRETDVDGSRIDGRLENEVRNAGRGLGEIGGERLCDGSTKVVTKTEGNEIINKEKSRTDRRATSSGFESSIVRARLPGTMCSKAAMSSAEL
jgi:hypothetical protein